MDRFRRRPPPDRASRADYTAGPVAARDDRGIISIAQHKPMTLQFKLLVL
ncbi:hypothetical protein [Sodalis praecaptivus]|nr:hypothetical protein [Sodalis praecaptivus]